MSKTTDTHEYQAQALARHRAYMASWPCDDCDGALEFAGEREFCRSTGTVRSVHYGGRVPCEAEMFDVYRCTNDEECVSEWFDLHGDLVSEKGMEDEGYYA